MRITRRTTLLALALWLAIASSAAAIVVTRVTVATTATLIYTAAAGGSTVLVRNASAVSVYVGAAGVTSATGFEVLAGDAVTLPLGPSDPLYGAVATGTAVVHVMESRR